MKRQYTFSIFDTMDEAVKFRKTIKRHLRGAITPWKEKKIIVWYKF